MVVSKGSRGLKTKEKVKNYGDDQRSDASLSGKLLWSSTAL